MDAGLFELAVVVFIAAGLGIAAKILKQPIILAYLAVGIVVGYFSFFNLADKEFFRIFSDLGIMFLLFLVGLEINYTSLRMVGRASAIVGIAQIIFTFTIGYLIALFFNFSYLHSAYISIALTFSSTVIVVKLLSEKKDLNSLYGKISIGVLLMQDLVAILILIFLAGVENSGAVISSNIIFAVLKTATLFISTIYIGRKILPLLFDKIARSSELLFIASLAWVFLMATLADKIGFPIEIGGFLAGLALANSSENFQIAARIRSLRDFFILIFFVILGSSLMFSNFSGLLLPIIVLSLFVLIGNPLIVMIIMGILGYRKKTGFLTGITIAQISEFSLVLAALGFKLGHLNENVVALITAVGIITILSSTYLVIHADKIFRYFFKYLDLFERKKIREYNSLEKEFNKPIILIGSHRTGASIAHNIPKEDLLIIDFDPEIIAQLKKYGYDYLFGDISDLEIFEKANLDKAKLIISTSPDLEDNLTLLSEIMKFLKDNRPKIILRARTEKEAEILYSSGADYVLLPHFTAGQYLGKTIAVDPEMKILEQLKERDLDLIKKVNHEI